MVGGGTSPGSKGRVSAAGTGDGSSFLAMGGAGTEGQLFKSLADHSREFIGICDMEFKPFYVNEAGMKMFISRSGFGRAHWTWQHPGPS